LGSFIGSTTAVRCTVPACAGAALAELDAFSLELARAGIETNAIKKANVIVVRTLTNRLGDRLERSARSMRTPLCARMRSAQRGANSSKQYARALQ